MLPPVAAGALRAPLPGVDPCEKFEPMSSLGTQPLPLAFGVMLGAQLTVF